MRHLLAAALVLAVSATASAQSMAIHGHPQKAIYNSPAEWPFLSAQGHWAPATDMVGMSIGHNHVECKAPVWAETTTDAFTLPCQLVFFHTSGYIAWVTGEFVSHIVWEETGSETPPVLVGDPMGVVVHKMLVTIDPKRADGVSDSGVFNVPAHGWWEARLRTKMVLFNGDSFSTELWMPYFSVIDKAQPIPAWAAGPTLAARNVAESPRSMQSGFGTHVAEYGGTFPPILAPISTRKEMTVFTYAYAHQLPGNAPLGTYRQVLDPDLHHGNPGTLITSSHSVGGLPNGDPAIFDPAVMGPGVHTVAIDWEQTTDGQTTGFEANQQVTARLVVTVTVGDDVPPPPPPPPHPPMDTWTTFAPIFQRLGDAVRVCAPDGKCLSLGAMQAP